MSGEAAAGVQAASRADRAAAWLGDRGLDALLVTDLVNVRYLTGFTGSNGLALIGAGGERLFITDFRYVTQSAEQVDRGFERVMAESELFDALVGAMTDVGLDGGARIGFDDAHMSVKAHERLAGLVAPATELVAAGGFVERMRAVKEPGEARRIRAAAVLVDDVYGWIAERGLSGRVERDVALEIETEMRRRGAQAPSFPSIVASGERGSLPHAEPSGEAIPSAAMVTIDIGALLDGYCSDCTRTFATGPISDEQTEVYELVLGAQQAALESVAPGLTGREVDAVAREIIEAAGHGEHFGHGLGHGVGLEIHEAPRLARRGGNEALVAGNVVTVEPGVYVPGSYGVRIEDLVLVADDGYELLSRFPKDLLTVE